ncbi:hypothetical protein ACN47E_007394 [Coniothyrium glycines]
MSGLALLGEAEAEVESSSSHSQEARGRSSAQPSHAPGPSTCSENTETSLSTLPSASTCADLFAHLETEFCSFYSLDGTLPDLDLDFDVDLSPSFARDEDGGGSMVLDSPGALQSIVVARHGAPDHPSLPAAEQRLPAMPAATLDAPALPAPAHHLAPAAPALPPPPDTASTRPPPDAPDAPNGLPPLDAPPVSFPQTGSMNDMDMDMGLGLGMAMDLGPGFSNADFTGLPTVTDERLTAFARLRFDDGSYYMHTYQITLGRNIALAHRDMRRLAKHDQLQAEGHSKAAEDVLKGKRDKKKKHKRGARSVISEKGGIVSAPIESMPLEYQQRRQSNASHSPSSASHSKAESGEEKPAERAPQDLLMQALPEVPAQFDGHVPEDPNDCPLVPIHPQHITARTGAQGPKGISREHARIFYDFDNGCFCVKVLGSNGLHHQRNFIPQGETVPLDHNDHLLIGAVNIQFFLPDVALTEEQRQRQESGSRPMSFSFENGHGELESDEQMSSESEGEQSVNPRHVYHYPLDSESDSDEGIDEDDYDDYEEPLPRPRKKEQKQSLKIKIKAPPPPPLIKESKKAHKRKHRELTPEEPPPKKLKQKLKEVQKEPMREPKASKEPKEAKDLKETKDVKDVKDREPKEKGKAPAKAPVKAPSKTPIKDETPVEEVPKEIAVKEKPEPKPINDSPPLLRKPFEGEIESGEIEGLITEEMARQHNLPATLIGHVVEKRKGPGRPPKDGIMSKRQRSQLIKQAKEIERAKAAGIDPADIPAPSMKPKPPKRKESNAADGDGDEIMESTEPGDGTALGDKRQAKPIKPPRTPSPEMRIEDYSEEQLQRPSANYVVLIHEAISSSSTGQMNLQQIYNYIEKKYPWYKFKTTTSGWQSSVRHNLGQHDAFVKGDKEGKGFNWRVNPEVSIEKERRKRQVSPPINHAQRQPYYPPPNGYPPYPPPGYPYHPGMPQNMPPAAPRLPPSLAQPRLPPSMARDANAAAPAAPQGAPPPSPYASPWAGGNPAGSPSANAARPYPQPTSQTPPVNSTAGPSGQYGVLYPTAAPQNYSTPPAPSPYAGPYAAAGASPYGPAPPRPYAPYPPPAQQPNGASAPSGPSVSPYGPTPMATPVPQHHVNNGVAPHPSGRYPLATHPDLIRQLEAFREAYLKQRVEPGEQTKVDNAIRACVDTTVPEVTLTGPEKLLLTAIRSIAAVAKLLAPSVKPQDVPVNQPAAADTDAAGTAASIAADAVANSAAAPQNGIYQSASITDVNAAQNHTPNMMGSTFAAHASGTSAHPLPASHRPSVEPLTPVPGSPALQNGTPVKRNMTEITAESMSDVREDSKDDSHTEAGVTE